MLRLRRLTLLISAKVSCLGFILERGQIAGVPYEVDATPTDETLAHWPKTLTGHGTMMPPATAPSPQQQQQV